MRQMVITVIGEDRAGLVEVLSGAIAEHGGNWERSRMAELAGTFAGVVLVAVPEAGLAALTADLESIEARGLLHVSITEAASGRSSDPAAPAGDNGPASGGGRFQLRLVGQDHPGIVHEISSALATHNVSIEELETAVVPAPMGGMLFEAEATLEAPPGVTTNQIQDVLEAVAQDLMVDLEISPDQN